MRARVLRPAALAIALAATASLSTATLSATSQTSLSGFVSGRELCEQAVCGSAIFLAAFAGTIDNRPAFGLALGGIVHEPLPQNPGECVNILGGSWSISTLRRTLSGDVNGGQLCYVDGVRYQVLGMSMEITQGGSGEAVFNAVLDHGPFPPTIRGAIEQP
jgi:hypothetical protein